VLREMRCAAIAQAIGEPTPKEGERATMRVKLPKPVAAIYKAVEELEARSSSLRRLGIRVGKETVRIWP
jgi:hypothetical protein